MEFVQPIRDKKQIDAMKKILKATSVRDFCLFTLGINCGLRISDLLNLLINDVMDEKSKLKDRIAIREQKTGKTKDFPISEIAAKAINEYLAMRGNYNLNDHYFFLEKQQMV
jgi:integrase